MKNVTVLTKDGAFALFFPPHPGGFDSSRVPIPREFAIQGQKIANAGGQPGAGVGLGTAGIDWCINITISPLSHTKCRVFHLCSFSSLWACRASFTAFLELGWTTFLQWTFDFPSLGWKKTTISLQSYCSVHLLDEFVKKEHVRVSFYPLDFDRKQTNNTHLTICGKLASFWKDWETINWKHSVHS